MVEFRVAVFWRGDDLEKPQRREKCFSQTKYSLFQQIIQWSAPSKVVGRGYQGGCLLTPFQTRNGSAFNFARRVPLNDRHLLEFDVVLSFSPVYFVQIVHCEKHCKINKSRNMIFRNSQNVDYLLFCVSEKCQNDVLINLDAWNSHHDKNTQFWNYENDKIKVSINMTFCIFQNARKSYSWFLENAKWKFRESWNLEYFEMTFLHFPKNDKRHIEKLGRPKIVNLGIWKIAKCQKHEHV